MPQRKTFKRIVNKLPRLAANICLALIWIYQKVISPLKPPVCRFYPSCSQYCFEAVQRHGLVRGGAMSIKRVLHCHPFNPGGYDPVR